MYYKEEAAFLSMEYDYHPTLNDFNIHLTQVGLLVKYWMPN